MTTKVIDKKTTTVTKKDFVDALHEVMMRSDFKWKDACTKSNTEKIYDNFVDLLIEVIKKNPEGFKLGRLGTFKVRKKASRQGKNPRTGAPIVIAARKDLTFKASSNIKEEINA